MPATPLCAATSPNSTATQKPHRYQRQLTFRCWSRLLAGASITCNMQAPLVQAQQTHSQERIQIQRDLIDARPLQIKAIQNYGVHPPQKWTRKYEHQPNFLTLISKGNESQNQGTLNGNTVVVKLSPVELREQIIKANQTNLSTDCVRWS